MKKTRDTKSILLRVLLYLFVILVVLVTLYPYFVMFTTAAKSRAEIYSTDGTLLPIHWLWQNFKDIWTLAPLSRYFINSLIVAGGSTLIAIVCGIPAAYALARMKFKGKKIFLGIVIISQMFAPVVLLVGIYKIMSTFGMTDSLVGLVFINAAFNQAFAIWLLRGYLYLHFLLGNGTGSYRRRLWKGFCPDPYPSSCSSTWYRYCPDFRIHQRLERIYRCSTLISTDVLKPLTVGITIFNGYNMVEWQYLFASSLFATVPVIILFVAIEKHLVGGLNSGGVKG